MATTGQKLKKMRVDAGLTQAQVARRFRYNSPQFISNWERDLVLFPAKVIPVLATLYGVSRTVFVEILVSEFRARVLEDAKCSRAA